MSRVWQLCFPALVLMSCHEGGQSHEVVYGEPTGIQMPAAQGLPALEIALAVSQGAAVDVLVSPVSAAIHEALRVCPDVVARGATGEVAQASFAIEGGRVRGASGLADDACILRALEGKSMPAGARVDVLVQLRFTALTTGAASPG